MVVWRGVLVTGGVVLVGVLLWWSRPHPETRPPLRHSSPHGLLDLPTFSFYSEHPCNDSEPPSVVTIVHSAPDNRRKRDSIRATWGRRMRVLFLLGESSLDLGEEDAEYGDLVRGSFLDSYRNLTYKHVMGLKWAVTKCPSAQFVVKTDDDVFVEAEALSSLLASLPKERLIACPVTPPRRPDRSYRSKWRVSNAEYPYPYYPRYCMGWAVVYSADAAQLLLEQAKHREYFWVDDVFVTGVLASRVENLTHLDISKLVRQNTQVLDSGPSEPRPVFSLTTHASHLFLLDGQHPPSTTSS